VDQVKVLADDGDGLVDAGTLVRCQGRDVAPDVVDEFADLADLLFGRGRGCACPAVGAAGGGEPFPGAESAGTY
jgi:hypothetical protein